MKTIDILENNEGGQHFFQVTLRPRRSADPRVAYTFCGVLGFFWMCASVVISTMGGWPVVGFFGAEFIVIAGMVRVFLKRLEILETIIISATDVTITRLEHGLKHQMSFPAYWTQIHFPGSATLNRALEIRSHGEGIEIGKFLSSNEKAKIAHNLAKMLDDLRAKLPQNERGAPVST